MSREHLARVKLELAARYDRKSLQAGSAPLRRKFKVRADRYRRQAEEIRRS